ncbi:hypothetical protein [Streptomyces sp. NPDC048142]|uniref:hypothetical protein n=1 Tax=Streptomyces sp. NPDC048142 TaxID=3365501 RepID=UPI0037128118
MGETPSEQMPFRIAYDETARHLVMWMTYGSGPKQTIRRKEVGSVEALAVTVARHHYEAFLQGRLADELTRAGVDHLGADPARLEAAVRALLDPACSVSLRTLLHGPTPPPPSAGSPPL